MLCSDETVGDLSFAALGAHASLIESAWFQDGLPQDPGNLLAVRARGAEEFAALWPQIEHLWPVDAAGRRRNPWLEQQRAESEQMRERKRSNRRSRRGRQGSDDNDGAPTGQATIALMLDGVQDGWLYRRALARCVYCGEMVLWATRSGSPVRRIALQASALIRACPNHEGLNEVDASEEHRLHCRAAGGFE